MTKADHIAYWMNAADQNWQEVGTMFTAGIVVDEWEPTAHRAIHL